MKKEQMTTSNFSKQYFKNGANLHTAELPPIQVLSFIKNSLSECATLTDIGCGIGKYSNWHSNVVGYDCMGNNNIIDLDNSPEPITTTEGALCIEVIEHLMFPENVFIFARKAGAKKLVLTTPNAAWWKHRLNLLCGKDSFSDAYSPHIRRFTLKTLIDMAQKNRYYPAKIRGTYAGIPCIGWVVRKGGLISLFSAGLMVEFISK